MGKVTKLKIPGYFFKKVCPQPGGPTLFVLGIKKPQK